MSSPCDLLLSQLDKGLSEITGISKGLKSQVDGVMDHLSDVVGLPIDTLNDAADEVKTVAVDEAQTAIDSVTGAVDGADCGLVDECLDGVMSQIKDMVSIDLPTNVTIPDIPLLNEAMAFVDDFTGALNAYATELVQYGLDKIITTLDIYIGCLDSNPDGPSAEELQLRMDDLSGVITDLKLGDDGILDLDVIYDGVDQEYIDTVNEVSIVKDEASAEVKSVSESALSIPKSLLPKNFL